MDLSLESLDGLQIAGDNSFIPDKVFSLLATETCESLLNSSKKNCVLGRNQTILSKNSILSLKTIPKLLI